MELSVHLPPINTNHPSSSVAAIKSPPPLTSLDWSLRHHSSGLLGTSSVVGGASWLAVSICNGVSQPSTASEEWSCFD
eukprot:scaffold2163_cov267-Alexandrium_tamarense.AAC.8